MKALIIATGYCPNNPLSDHSPAPLLPLVDRPFLQHVIEFLVDQGVNEFDFVLSHLPEKIEQFLGDGTRWGSTFRFHLTREASQPYSALKAVQLGTLTEPVLLVHADRLLDIQLAQTRPLLTPYRDPVVFYWTNRTDTTDEHPQWTGWAWVSGPLLAQLVNENKSETIDTQLWEAAHHHGSLVEVPKPLSVESCDELLAAHQAVLAKQFSGLMLKGREVESGVWISRNVKLHPTAHIVPPVYIGENCWIEEHVTLGPYTILGRNCVINPQSTIRQSVILPGSYIGEGLELTETFVDRNRLVNVRVGTEVMVTDDFILGSLLDQSLSQKALSFFSRATAIFLLLWLWPVMLLTVLILKIRRRRPVVFRPEVVHLPITPGQVRWRTFRLWSFCSEASTAMNKRVEKQGRLRHLFLEVLPGLLNVAGGEMHFVGVSPRTKEGIEQLPPEWRSLYLQSKAGMISEAQVQYGGNASDDELYSAEAFYAVQSGFRHDVKLMFKYIKYLFTNSDLS